MEVNEDQRVSVKRQTHLKLLAMGKIRIPFFIYWSAHRQGKNSLNRVNDQRTALKSEKGIEVACIGKIYIPIFYFYFYHREVHSILVGHPDQ
jgi:hypothetical protein